MNTHPYRHVLAGAAAAVALTLAGCANDTVPTTPTAPTTAQMNEPAIDHIDTAVAVAAIGILAYLADQLAVLEPPRADEGVHVLEVDAARPPAELVSAIRAALDV